VSYSVDVNLLLYASDASSPHHDKALRFVRGLPDRADVLCLTWPTLIGYLRMSTHAAIFASPLSPEQATANVAALCALPRARIITEEEGFFATYRDVTANLAIRGNLVPDAHLAALLRQHGVRTLFTADADFLRFAFLDVQNPVA
jgi:hypothetical protein